MSSYDDNEPGAIIGRKALEDQRVALAAGDKALAAGNTEFWHNVTGEGERPGEIMWAFFALLVVLSAICWVIWGKHDFQQSLDGVRTAYPFFIVLPLVAFVQGAMFPITYHQDRAGIELPVITSVQKALLTLALYSFASVWFITGVLASENVTLGWVGYLALLLGPTMTATVFRATRSLDARLIERLTASVLAVICAVCFIATIPAYMAFIAGVVFASWTLLGVGISVGSLYRGIPGRRIWPSWCFGLVVSLVVAWFGVSKARSLQAELAASRTHAAPVPLPSKTLPQKR